MWREHAHVAALAGLCSATLAGGDGGYRAAGSSSGTSRDRSKRPLVGLSGAGAPLVCVRPPWLVVVGGYIPMVGMTSTLRDVEGRVGLL